MTSLNPVMTIGSQIDDIVRRHTGLRGKAVRRRTVELLDLVGIPNPERRADDHPHQFSGGMRQRVLIAIAISCDPEPADRRRTHHRPRRHRAGADPALADAAAGGARDVPHADHARFRGRRRNGRTGQCHVPRRDRGDRLRSSVSSRSPRTSTRGPCLRGSAPRQSRVAHDEAG